MMGQGTHLARLETPIPGPQSRLLAERLGAVESRNVTFRSHDFPVFWSGARGSNVQDVDGNVYVDFTGAFGVAFAGHGNPQVVSAVELQAGQLLHGMGDVHPPTVKVELLERLAALAPWSETRGLLAGSGSEAVEAALKTGALASGRPGILAFEGSYHGLTLGSLAATHRSDFRDPFRRRLYEGVSFTPFPGPDLGEALERFRLAVGREAPDGSRIGTVIIEPIQGRAGVRVPPLGYLEAMIDIAHDAGCVVIFDEIFTGFGRTGSLFAGPTEPAGPDVLCVGKALGGGLPIGACLARAEIMDAWPPSKGEALHTSTFLGNPVVAAAALGFLDALETEGLVGRARDLGLSMIDVLRRSLSAVPDVSEVRGRGLMIGLELVTSGGEPLVGGAVDVMKAALSKGVLVLAAGEHGNVVELTPPAVLTGPQAELGIRVVTESIKDVVGAG